MSRGPGRELAVTSTLKTVIGAGVFWYCGGTVTFPTDTLLLLSSGRVVSGSTLPKLPFPSAKTTGTMRMMIARNVRRTGLKPGRHFRDLFIVIKEMVRRIHSTGLWLKPFSITGSCPHGIPEQEDLLIALLKETICHLGGNRRNTDPWA
jgi:hypothetical protein